MNSQLKIGLCGAHGTGKTTILNEIIKLNKDLQPLSRTLRTMWENYGVEDFEKLPADIRTHFQNWALINQINREDETQESFVTDRTVIDILAYTRLSSDMTGSTLAIHQALIKERMKNYTHIFYFPVEFDVEEEKLRANIESRTSLDRIFQDILTEFDIDYTKLTGSLQSRVEVIKKVIPATL